MVSSDIIIFIVEAIIAIIIGILLVKRWGKKFFYIILGGIGMFLGTGNLGASIATIWIITYLAIMRGTLNNCNN